MLRLSSEVLPALDLPLLRTIVYEEEKVILVSCLLADLGHLH